MHTPTPSRRSFLTSVGLAASSFTFPHTLGAAPAPKRPNVLLIIADDQTWRDNGCYGNPDVKTPHIDKLAAHGMRFTHCFTATAMCAPTRQQLYTGIFPVRNGAYPNHSRVYPGTKSIVHHLKALGYRVGLHGKRHFGPPESFPFENARDVRQFVQRDKNQPYCLIYASHSPHVPWKAGDASAYDPAKIAVPPYLVDNPETRQNLCKYYAEITDFDREVGECVAAIDDGGQADDTLFIYTSEQGAQFPFGKWTCYDVGLRTALVVRWPRRVRPASVAKAMVQYVDVLPTLIEAAGGKVPDGLDGTSFLRVLLGEVDEHRDIVYGCHTTRGIIAGSQCYPIRSIRTRMHKLILNLNHKTAFRNTLIASDRTGYWRSWVRDAKTDEHAAERVRKYQHRPALEFYDIVKDPFEMSDLAADPAHWPLMADLEAKLLAWMAQQGDQGNATEMKARERQGRGRKKKPRTSKQPPKKARRN